MAAEAMLTDAPAAAAAGWALSETERAATVARIASTLSEHPVVVATAAAGLLLGAIPLALPIEGSSTLLRSAGVAMLLIGLPPLLTSRYVEATARAAVVTLSGALLLRAAILGPLDALSSLVIAGGFAALLLTGTAVAGQLTKAEEA